MISLDGGEGSKREKNNGPLRTLQEQAFFRFFRRENHQKVREGSWAVRDAPRRRTRV